MNAPFRKPWTQTQFFAWDGHREGRYEFDGAQPVAMTGGTANHSLITGNVNAVLRGRLRGSGCQPLGPDAGIATVGDAVRYPDALVTCSEFAGSALTIPGVVVVFEVLIPWLASRDPWYRVSFCAPPPANPARIPNSGRTDRIVKVGEYAAVPSILRYVILESTSVGLTVFERPNAGEPWRACTLTGEDDILRMPEIGIEVVARELYEGVALNDTGEPPAAGETGEPPAGLLRTPPPR